MCRTQLARAAFWRWYIVYGWVLSRLFPLSLEKQLVSVNPHIPKTRGSNDQRAMGEFPKNVEPSVRPGASVGSPGTTVTELTQDLHQSWAPMLVCGTPRWSSWAGTDPVHGRLFLRRTGQSPFPQIYWTVIWKRVRVLSLSRLSVVAARALKQRRTCGHKRLLFF